MLSLATMMQEREGLVQESRKKGAGKNEQLERKPGKPAKALLGKFFVSSAARCATREKALVGGLRDAGRKYQAASNVRIEEFLEGVSV